VPSSWIVARPTNNDGRNKGRSRYRVLYRLGGRESTARYAGSFVTKSEAVARKRWVDGELAARRVPDLAALVDPVAAPTLRVVAAQWQASRVDISDNTRLQHRSAIHAVTNTALGDRPVDRITAADVAELVGKLSAKGRKRETIRKSLLVGGMILDYAGVSPNPFRDKITVRLPRETKTEIAPPTAEQVQAVHDVLPERYRLPLIVLDATGMRLGELEGLRWGDVDERRGRWRVSRAVAKTGHGRWVSVPPVVFEAVLGLVAREDRTADRKVFQGFGGDRFRTAIARGCTTAGVPAFSPHDLRHRRISLLHLGGVPWARIGEHVGQRNLGVTANTYTHVLSDEAELDLEALLCSSGATPGATPERTKRRIAG
jgi:integrase